MAQENHTAAITAVLPEIPQHQNALTPGSSLGVAEVLLRKAAVLQLTGLSNSSFYGLIRDGKIKPGVPIGLRSRAWPASEVQSFIVQCVAERDQQMSEGAK